MSCLGARPGEGAGLLRHLRGAELGCRGWGQGKGVGLQALPTSLGEGILGGLGGHADTTPPLTAVAPLRAVWRRAGWSAPPWGLAGNGGKLSENPEPPVAALTPTTRGTPPPPSACLGAPLPYFHSLPHKEDHGTPPPLSFKAASGGGTRSSLTLCSPNPALLGFKPHLLLVLGLLSKLGPPQVV